MECSKFKQSLFYIKKYGVLDIKNFCYNSTGTCKGKQKKSKKNFS